MTPRQGGRPSLRARCPLGLFLILILVSVASVADPVATVGQRVIDERAIEQAIGVQKAYGVTVGRMAATVLVIREAIEAEVASRVGVEVSGAEIAAFSRDVDAHTRAPEVLRRVKAVFQGDETAYRRRYLLPRLVSNRLHDWFMRDESMQRVPREAIQRAYALALSGQGLASVARGLGLRLVKGDYAMRHKEAPAALKRYFSQGLAAMTPGFRRLLDGLEPGAMAQTIAEDDRDYRVVRLIGKDAQGYRTEEVVADKLAFDPWYRKQQARIGVTIRDPGLLHAIRAAYPRLPWRMESGPVAMHGD